MLPRMAYREPEASTFAYRMAYAPTECLPYALCSYVLPTVNVCSYELPTVCPMLLWIAHRRFLCPLLLQIAYRRLLCIIKYGWDFTKRQARAQKSLSRVVGSVSCAIFARERKSASGPMFLPWGMRQFVPLAAALHVE